MNDEISALLGAEYQDPNSPEAMAMAQQLRGNLRNADFLSLSSVQPVAQYGMNARDAVTNAAQTRGRLNRAIASEERGLERQKAQENRAETRTIASEDRALKRALEQETRQNKQYRDRADDNRTSVRYVDRNGKVVMIDRDATGQLFLQGEGLDAQPLTRDDIEYMGLTLYDENVAKAGGRASGGGDDEVDIEREIRTGGFVGNALRSNLMQAATGKYYDPMYLAGELTGTIPDVSSQQTRLKKLTAEAAAPMLDTLGVNPTDRDVTVAFNTVPQVTDEPQTWLDWYVEQYVPRLLSDVKKGRRPELADMVRAEAEKTIRIMQAEIDRNKKSSAWSFPETEKRQAQDPMQLQQPPASSGVDDLLQMYPARGSNNG